MENLARYIIRASFSQERMTYLPDEPQLICRSKDNRQEKNFDALDWLASFESDSHTSVDSYRLYYMPDIAHIMISLAHSFFDMVRINQ